MDGRGQRVARPGMDGGWPWTARTGRSRSWPIARLCWKTWRRPRAVAGAVRLAVTHMRLQEEQQERLGELEASRARLVAAADRHARAAAELRQDVEAPLRVAQSELRAMRPGVRDPEAAAAVDVVVQELAAATGSWPTWSPASPANLGGGRLGRALHALAEASPIPVTVAVAEDAAASQETETALFYVCCRRWPTRSSTQGPRSRSRWSVRTEGWSPG